MPQRKNPLAQSSTRPPFAPVPMLLTAKEAASYLGINLYEVYRRTAAGEIPARVWGHGARNLRWLRTDLDAWLASLPASNGPVRAKPTTRREPEPAAS
jgi:excisionase family DNA binding protein